MTVSFFCLSIHPSACLQFLTSVCPSLRLSVPPYSLRLYFLPYSLSLPVSPSVRPSFYQFCYLPLCLSVCTSVPLSVCTSVYLSIPPSICLYTPMSVCLFLCFLPVCLSVCSSIRSSVRPTVFCLPDHSYICLPICLSVSLQTVLFG